MQLDFTKEESNGDDNVIYVIGGQEENTITLICYRTINIITK